LLFARVIARSAKRDAAIPYEAPDKGLSRCARNNECERRAVSAVSIRSGRRQDLAAIVGLLADDPFGQSREQDSEPLADAYLRAFDDIAAQPGNFLFVAELDGEVVGCLQLTVIPGLSRRGMKRGQIEAVRVAARCRRSGVGEHLVRHAIERARAAGCGLVQLTSDKLRPDAHRFYERLGFTPCHIGLKLMFD
jgi:ribosomal protein S18 acetylase RimI-like enzyme